VVNVPQKFDGFSVTISISLLILVLHLSYGSFYAVQNGGKK
jgi:hypothetical protein